MFQENDFHFSATLLVEYCNTVKKKKLYLGMGCSALSDPYKLKNHKN